MGKHVNVRITIRYGPGTLAAEQSPDLFALLDVHYFVFFTRILENPRATNVLPKLCYKNFAISSRHKAEDTNHPIPDEENLLSSFFSDFIHKFWDTRYKPARMDPI